jgi:hypothetical protein
LESFREIAKLEDGENGEIQAVIFHTVALKKEERFLDAFETFETALKKFPDDLGLQSEWNQFKQNALQMVESRLSRNPWDTGAALLYDKFLTLGDVTIRLHAIMVEHYRLIGANPKAKVLAEKVFAVAPNYPGIQETIRRLNQKEA